jgi:hypothetical protein
VMYVSKEKMRHISFFSLIGYDTPPATCGKNCLN